MKHATWMALIVFLGLAPSLAKAKVMYEGINTQFDDGVFTTHIGFNSPVDPDTVHLEFINQTIQLNIPDAVIPGDRDLVRVGKNKVKSVYSYQRPDSVLRTRLIYDKPIKAIDFKESVRLVSEGNSLKVMVKAPDANWAKTLPAIAPVDLNFELEKEVAKIMSPKTESATAIVAREFKEDRASPLVAKFEVKEKTEKTEKNKKTLKKESVSRAKDKSKKQTDSKVALGGLKEAEIPVLTGKKKEIKAESGAFARMLWSLAIIGLLGGGLLLFSKWWAKNNKMSLGNNKIRVVTQHHMGPKKSLAIVRVAGEHILIGVTDHNINMIKTLSLIDDEIPEEVPNNFSQSLAQADPKPVKMKTETPDEEREDFAFGNIRESVSRKLRDMRQI